MNDTLEVPTRPHVLDGNATLKNLQNYSYFNHLPNNSIVYLYTNNTLDIKDYKGPAFPDMFSTLSTNGTFCSNTSSAAILRHPPGNSSYWDTVKVTANIFGAKYFVNFTEEDMMKMNETFSHCHVNKSSA
ncbi:hypothetical protein MRX96_031300 [Rhipicephalus microplus]